MKKIKINDLTNTTIVALVIVALGLGVALYFKNGVGDTQRIVKPAEKKVYKNLADLEKSILLNPDKDAPEEAFRAYSAVIAANASPGQTVYIKDCTARPLVLQMTYGKILTVVNEGKTDIHFGFGDSRTLVKAGSTTKITTNFKNGEGIYGYGCDDSSLGRSIGVLLLTK